MSFGFGFGFPKRLTSGGGLSPRLYLDFVGTGVLPSTVTFSRGTNATLTDSNGRIAWAPHNLLTNSEDFEAAAWVKSPLGVGVAPVVTANQAVAPDGSTTADLVVLSNTGTTTGDWSWLYQNFSAAASTTYTFSAWVRASGPAEIGKVIALVGAIGAITLVTLTADWQRVTQTNTTVGAATISVGPRLRGTETTATTASFFIWGAQLNIGSTAQSYNSTTPKNLLGFTQEPENAAWTKSNSYVQQNLLTWSQDFDNAAWGKGNGTVTANSTVAPDGSTSADTFVTTAATAATFVQQTFTSVASAYAFSAYVKANGVQFVQLLWAATQSTNFANFDLSAGTVGTNTATSATITAVGNGWYRIAIVSTLAAAAGAANIYCVPASTSARGNSFAGNGTSGIFIWGAQLVQGSTAGDYTQTTSAAAPTRYLNWDGTLTGRKLVENTAAAQHQILQSQTLTAATYTLTVYAKADQGPQRWLSVYPQGTGVTAAAVFDINAGAVTSTLGAQLIGSSIVSVGGGWYRCSVTFTGAAVSVASVLYLSNASNAASPGYTGDGTSGIYVSDFQLSNSASVDPYVYNPQAAAASAAFYGPRFDYDPVTLAAKGLLIEEQRTNLLTYSEDFSNAVWVKNAAPYPLVTTNTDVAPDGTVTMDTVTGEASLTRYIQQNSTVTASTTYTASIYLKAGTSTLSVIRIFNSTVTTLIAGVNINWSGAIPSVGTTGGSWSTTPALTLVGNGIYRLTGSFSSGANTSIAYLIYPDNSATGSGSVKVWGAQLEAGSFATSYIPTQASQVTRNADSASMLGDNFYTWYNPNQGTLSAEADSYTEQIGINSYNLASINDGTTSNYIRTYLYATNGGLNVRSGNVVQADIPVGTWSRNVPFKTAGVYKLNDFQIAFNGTLGTPDTSGTIPTVSQLNIGANNGVGGFTNGHIRRISYYSTRLPDSTLQALTT